MINTIRNQFRQSTYRYVIFFIVFVMVFGMISTMFMKTDRSAASWAIKVNNKKIDYQDFAREVAQQAEFIAQFRAQYGQYADLLFQSMGWKVDPKALAIDVLVKEELINQYADNLGISLHPDYIAQSVNDSVFAQRYLGGIVPTFVFNQSGVLDLTILGSYLKQTGRSMKEFEYKLERSLKALQAMQFIVATSYVPLFDTMQQFITKNLGKKFSVLTFSLDTFLAEQKKQAIKLEELELFYTTQNKQFRRYWIPEKRNGIVWKCKPANYGIVVSEDDIKEYYETNKVKMFVADPIKIEVRQITEKQLNQPDVSLEMIRADLIENQSSSWNKQWQLVPPFARGEKKGAFEQAAFVLQEEGDISPVIETNNGKVLLQLLRRIPRTYKPLSEVRNEIKNKLIDKKFNKSFTKDIKNIVLQGDKMVIEDFIVKKTGKKEFVSDIIKDDSRLSQELFVLKKNEYGFYVDGEMGVIVLLTDIQDRTLPELASVKDVVTNDFYEERARRMMHERALEAQKAAANGDFDQLASQFKASLEHTEMIQPSENKKIQELEKKGMPLQTMLTLEKEGSILVHNSDKNSFLIKLDMVEECDENKLLAAQKEIKEHFGPIRIKLYMDSFVASLHRNATIETNGTILIAGEEYSE